MGRHLGIDFGAIWVDFGRQVGFESQRKIDQKSNSTWEGILASIFERFCWILGGKLGSKIEQKSIQKGIEKVNVLKSRKIKKNQIISETQRVMGGFSRQGKGRGLFTGNR